jgi:hypothetical protein
MLFLQKKYFYIYCGKCKPPLHTKLSACVWSKLSCFLLVRRQALASHWLDEFANYTLASLTIDHYIGYSDFDVFKENDRGTGVHRCKK